MVSLAPLLSLPCLEDDLARVEKALLANVKTGDPFLAEVASHLITAGGKRLRPALAVAVGELGGGPADDDVIMGAVAVELVHLGSLYHDDVMDEARTRRNVDSVNARWGNLVAILAGDFLLARASEIAASLGTEVAGLLAATIGRLCEGQVRELAQTFDVTRSEESYLISIAGKTAALMATACRVGAITAGIDRPGIEALTAYGEQVGMVFQIVDDILDVVATDEELGKPAGNDLVEGVYTLPVIRALASSQSSEELRRLLGSPLERDEVDVVRAIVRSNGAVGAAIDVARRYAGASAAALEGVPAGGEGGERVMAALASLGDHLIENIPRHD
ncbi:MAG TPA: polyprenyl synthetase family protein [Acidimicrobiales bacterium]|nr:polyprenyl synthetase family protein [Acidimicrobiales bacterium]